MSASIPPIQKLSPRPWQDRLANWAPTPNPDLPRCRYCGVRPTTHREYRPACGAPV